MAPKGTPPDIVRRLNAEITGIVGRPEVRDEWARHGAVAMKMNPEEFGRYIKSEIDKWARVVKVAGIKPE